MARAKPKKTLPVTPDAPGIDRTPDVTNWLAKWANVTAAIGVVSHEVAYLAACARPKAGLHLPALRVLGIDLERLNEIDTIMRELHGATLSMPFRGTLLRVGDGVIEDAAYKAEAEA